MDEESKKPVERKLDSACLKYSEETGSASGCPPPKPTKPCRLNNQIFQQYAKLKIFQEPVQLIAAGGSKLLCYNDEAIDELRKIEHHVNVVAVVGKYRTGKSLLLNRLANINKAFGVGDTHNAVTKGIWIFCRPHPKQKSQVLVLLDTEGLGDATKENMIEDKWHFVLATLLSSTLLYNHKGTLDAEAIKKLKFLKDFKTNVNALESERGDDSYLDVFFPAFVMVVRDNDLKPVDGHGNEISPDHFLENILVLKRGDNDAIRKFNEPRRLVRRYFKERKCFMISPPVSPKDLNDGRISANKVFESQVEKFVEYIYECKPKQMTSGKVLSGRMFSCLVRSYTTFIQEGKPPCIQEATKEMIEYENQNVLHHAVDIYKGKMHGLIGSNMPGSKTIVNLHEKSTQKAIDYLRENIVYDDVQLILDTAKESFLEVLAKFKEEIAKDSKMVCEDTLVMFNNVRIEKKMKAGMYAHVAGYDEYIKDIDWTVKMYRQTPGLGPKKETVLQSYLDGKEQEEEEVYKTVNKIQDGNLKGHGVKEIRRSSPRQLSMKDNPKSGPDSDESKKLLKLIMEDQNLQKQDMAKTFFTFMKRKIAEYDRQLAEGADSASVTKEENDHFKKTFCDCCEGSKMQKFNKRCRIL